MNQTQKQTDRLAGVVERSACAALRWRIPHTPTRPRASQRDCAAFPPVSSGRPRRFLGDLRSRGAGRPAFGDSWHKRYALPGRCNRMRALRERDPHPVGLCARESSCREHVEEMSPRRPVDTDVAAVRQIEITRIQTDILLANEAQ